MGTDVSADPSVDQGADRATSARSRLLFLDNLRAAAIVLVVVLHATITYMAFAPEWWTASTRSSR